SSRGLRRQPAGRSEARRRYQTPRLFAEPEDGMKHLAVVLGGIGLVIAASTTLVALGDLNPAIRSYSTSSPSLAVVASLAGIATFAAAALLALEVGRRPTALAVFALGFVWTADLWAGWSGAPTLLRYAGMLLVPMLAPAALLVVASVVGRTW